MKKVTTIDVAREAGVSQTTVSCVMNDKKEISISRETRERVLAAAEKLGYVVKAKKRAAKPLDLMIGLMVPNLSNLYYSYLAQGIELYAREQGVHTILCNTTRTPEMERYYVNYLVKQGVDGIIYSFTPNITKDPGVPVVVLGESVNPSFDLISLDSHASGQMIAEHLYQLGHRKFCVITSPIHQHSISSSRKARLEGILGKLSEYGLQNDVIVKIDPEERENIEWPYESLIGERYTNEVLRDHADVTAFIGINDMVAHSVISTLQRRAIRVPEDVAVCGFDNSPMATISTPQLTSIDHFTVHRGCMAVNFLKDKLQKRESNISPIIMNYQPRLIARGSTVLGME